MPCPAKGQEDDIGTGVSFICGEPGHAGTVQPGAEEAQEVPSVCYRYLMGGVKKREEGSPHW